MTRPIQGSPARSDLASYPPDEPLACGVEPPAAADRATTARLDPPATAGRTATPRSQLAGLAVIVGGMAGGLSGSTVAGSVVPGAEEER